MARHTDPVVEVTVTELVDLLLADPDDADDESLAVEVAMLEQLVRRAEAALAARVAAADRRQAWSVDGHRNARCWVQAITNCSHPEAIARVRTARLLDDLPEPVGEVCMSGQVGVAQTRELARLHDHPRCADQFADAAGLLVEHARTLPHAHFMLVTRRFEQLADTNGAHRHSEAAHDGRNTQITTVGTEIHIQAHGGNTQGALIREVFERYLDAEFHTDWDTCRTLHGPAATPEQCPRTPAQRRFDALHAIFTAAAEHTTCPTTNDTRRVTAPQVNIIVDLDTFQTATIALATGIPLADLHHDIDGGDLVGRRCETAAGAPIDPLDAVTAALTGHIRRVVLDPNGVTINLGRRRRLFTGLARYAALFNQQQCSWPGCNQKPRQVDHTRPFADNGPTDQTNAGPICGWHNRWRTRGYTPQRQPDNTWTITRPDGQPITHNPRGFQTIKHDTR